MNETVIVTKIPADRISQSIHSVSLNLKGVTLLCVEHRLILHAYSYAILYQ